MAAEVPVPELVSLSRVTVPHHRPRGCAGADPTEGSSSCPSSCPCFVAETVCSLPFSPRQLSPSSHGELRCEGRRSPRSGLCLQRDEAAPDRPRGEVGTGTGDGCLVAATSVVYCHFRFCLESHFHRALPSPGPVVSGASKPPSGGARAPVAVSRVFSLL